MRPTIRKARTISRSRCARRSVRCVSACACAAPRRSSRGRRAACTDSRSRRISTVPGARWATSRSIRSHSSPGSCSRISATRSTRWPTPRCTTRSSSRTCACRLRPACRCSCCRMRSTACASSASTFRDSASRRTLKRRMCWQARCCATHARKPSKGQWRRHARA